MIGPGDSLGRYRIEAILGRGSMGEVYRAVDPAIGRTVAIKTVRLDSALLDVAADDLFERFRREARSAGRLSHPNIVAVYDYGEEAGLYWLVMELVEGTTLAERIAGAGALPPGEACSVAIQACAALGTAHARGVVHRDIKPANLMIEAETGLVKVLDFGVARLDASELTRTGVVFGTPAYMAPEQILGRHVDHRSDLFSLGAVFHEALTGRKAFPGEHLATITYRIVNEEPEGFAEIPARLGEGYARVLGKALAKDPAARFQSAGELSEAIQTHALGAVAAPRAHPAGTPPGGWAPPPASPARRRRRPAVLAAALAATVAAGIGAWAIFGGTSRPTPPGGVAVAGVEPLAGGDSAAASATPAVDSTATGPLAADSATAADSPAADSTAAADTTAPADTAAPAVVEPTTGRLTVTANVPGHVWLGRRDLGPVPRRGLELGAGRRSLRFVPDAGAALAAERTVRIPAGGAATLSFEVTDGLLSVAVREPKWARVYVDDARLGDTPIIARRVRAGPHLVRVEREGYRPAERPLTIEAGGHGRWVDIRLEAAGGAP